MNTRFSLIKPSHTAGVILVLSAGVFWSIVPVGVRLLQEATVWQFLFYRSVGVLPLAFALTHYQSGDSGLISAFGLLVGGTVVVIAIIVNAITGMRHKPVFGGVGQP